ncbi:MAG: thiol reductase thioredoxin [Clostridiales bacterium GWE2_32_10]|nr:MAG: thiol reductase thioredoxin [Clostridiales bacterium GWE2_32_10]HBY19687.1 thioredoxin [Clostridiales bacterium]
MSKTWYPVFNKTNLIKIIFTVCILLVVGGIWIAKSNEKAALKNEQTEVINEQAEASSEQAGIEDEELIAKNEQPIALKNNSDFALHVVDQLDIEKLKSYGLPIVIDFGADSCIPCKEMAPVLKELNTELHGKAIIKFVDVWKYQKLADGYPISVIPTQIFFDKEGKPYVPSDPEKMQMLIYSHKVTNEHVFTTHEGGMTKEQLLSALKEMGIE